jgi:hypothetical protein
MRSRARDEAHEAKLAALRAEWREMETALACCLAQHAPLFDAVRMQVQPLWEALAGGRTFARKPSYGLRLFAADGQTLVGVSPFYNRRAQMVECSRVLLEVISEVERYTAAVESKLFYQLERRLILTVQAGTPPRWMRASRSAVDAVGALVLTLEQFLEDPPAVLRRSTMYCAICGRHLTDGQSRARGIGPECLRHVSTFVACAESIVGLVSAVPADERTPMLAPSL